MKIGLALPSIKLPVLYQDHFTYRSIDLYEGQWRSLCFLTHLRPCEMDLFAQQLPQFADEGAGVIGITGCAGIFHQSWLHTIRALSLPLVADPFRRLHRAYGLPSTWPAGVCQHILVDPKGVSRYHLVHHLNPRGFAFALEMLQSYQQQLPSPPYRATFDPHRNHCTLYQSERYRNEREGSSSHVAVSHA